MFDRNDDYFMSEALREARKAAEIDEVPVGCVIVHDGVIIARAHNQREMLKDSTAHAEMIAITQAAAALDDWRLENTTLYVTLEPCPMCAGAIVNARIPTLVWGADDPKAGACGSLFNVVEDRRLNHQVEMRHGVMAGPCGEILREFFRGKRKKADPLDGGGQREKIE